MTTFVILAIGVAIAAVIVCCCCEIKPYLDLVWLAWSDFWKRQKPGGNSCNQPR